MRARVCVRVWLHVADGNAEMRNCMRLATRARAEAPTTPLWRISNENEGARGGRRVRERGKRMRERERAKARNVNKQPPPLGGPFSAHSPFPDRAVVYRGSGDFQFRSNVIV